MNYVSQHHGHKNQAGAIRGMLTQEHTRVSVRVRAEGKRDKEQLGKGSPESEQNKTSRSMFQY